MAESAGSLELPFRGRQLLVKPVPPYNKTGVAMTSFSTSIDVSSHPKNAAASTPPVVHHPCASESSNTGRTSGYLEQEVKAKGGHRTRPDENPQASRASKFGRRDAESTKEKRRLRKVRQRAKKRASQEKLVKARYLALKIQYGTVMKQVRKQVRELAPKMFYDHDITLAQCSSILLRYSWNSLRKIIWAMAVNKENFDPTQPGGGFELLTEMAMMEWKVGVDEGPLMAPGGIPGEEEDEGDEAWLAKALKTLSIDESEE